MKVSTVNMAPMPSTKGQMLELGKASMAPAPSDIVGVGVVVGLVLHVLDHHR